MLCHIICKNSFPVNKVRREYFLCASVSCVTLFRKILFFCMCCVTSLVKNLPFSNTHCLPSHHLHLQSIYITHCIYCCQYTSVNVTPFVASRFSSAVHCMTLRDICRHSSSASVGRVIQVVIRSSPLDVRRRLTYVVIECLTLSCCKGKSYFLW